MKKDNSNILFHYDDEADVLYAHIGAPQNGVAVFDEGGIILRADPITGNFIGFTITNYMRRARKGILSSIPNFENIKLPIFS